MANAAAILIVEQDVHIGHLLQDTLTPEFQVQLARDSLEAVDALTQRRFALLIVDLDLPVLDGLSFLRLLRKNLNSIPAIALSTCARSLESKKHGLVQALLPEPFDLELLMQAIRQALQLSRQPAESG